MAEFSLPCATALLMTTTIACRKNARTPRMNNHPLALAIQQAMKFLLTVVCLFALRAVAIPAIGLPSGFPEVHLQKRMRGDEAIAGLGNKLPVVAAFYKKDEKELRELLRKDHSLWVDEHGRL